MVKISVDQQEDQSPLIRFRGVLKEVKESTYTPQGGGNDRLSLEFNFVDVTVIESREPYPFPIASVRIGYSDRGNTKWAAFTKSFKDIVPRTEFENLENPMKVLEGKGQEWYYAPAQLRLPLKNEDGSDKMKADGKPEWGVTEGQAWQLVSVDGYQSAGGPGLMDKILDFADGKGDQAIYTWIFTTQELKAYPDYNATVEGVVSKTLLPTLVAGGKLKANDNGTYSKVG